MVDCDLHDVPLESYKYTWSMWKGTNRAVKERLDRALVTPSWQTIFPRAKLCNLVASMSDHSLYCFKHIWFFLSSPKRNFRFENHWLKEPTLVQVVRLGWDNSLGDLLSRLDSVVLELEAWGRGV